MTNAAVDAILEIFVWVGVGAGLLVGLIALVAYVADGSWVPAQVVISDENGVQVARWFAHDGGVGSVALSPDQRSELAGREVADVFVRLGGAPRLRVTRHSPAVRFLLWLSIGLVALGALCGAVSLVLLFTR